jgi:hypothetical protein
VEVPNDGLLILSTTIPDSAAIAKVFMYWSQMEGIVYMFMDVMLTLMYIIHIRRMWNNAGSTKKVLAKVLGLTAYIVFVDLLFDCLSYTRDVLLVNPICVCLLFTSV